MLTLVNSSLPREEIEVEPEGSLQKLTPEEYEELKEEQEKPEVTVTPEPKKEPEATVTPEPTKEPEATVTPEPTKEPEATVTPEPTKEPEAAETPEITDEEKEEILAGRGMVQFFALREAGSDADSRDLGEETDEPVSYTHLDVYKRQGVYDSDYPFAD